MGKLCALVAAMFFGVILAGQACAQSPAPVTLIKAGRLLDPRTGNVLSPAAVLIESGKIKEVGAPSQVQAHAKADVKIIDLGSATLLPGLIDSHTHLLLDVIVPPEAERARRHNGDFAPGLLLAIIESPSKRVLMGAQLAHEDLESGFTTVKSGDPALMAMLRCGSDQRSRVPGRNTGSAGSLPGSPFAEPEPGYLAESIAAGISMGGRARRGAPGGERNVF
jgi:hypothetical protein